jgi:hypothetical protein
VIRSRSHIAQSRPPRNRERGDRSLVLGDLRHDRFLGAIEGPTVGGDEVLRLPQLGEISVDLRHDVASHHVPTSHRVFWVGPVVDEADDRAEAAADLEHGFDPGDQIVRGADRRRSLI